MYYDDEGRRFNRLSGLLFGALLGAGIALLVAPQRGVRVVRPMRRLARGARGRVGALRGKVFSGPAGRRKRRR